MTVKTCEAYHTQSPSHTTGAISIRYWFAVTGMAVCLVPCRLVKRCQHGWLVQLASIDVMLQVCCDLPCCAGCRQRACRHLIQPCICISCCATLACGWRSHTLRCELQLLNLNVWRQDAIEVHHQAVRLDAVRAPDHIQVSHLASGMCSRICSAGSCSMAAHTSHTIAGA